MFRSIQFLSGEWVYKTLFEPSPQVPRILLFYSDFMSCINFIISCFSNLFPPSNSDLTPFSSQPTEMVFKRHLHNPITTLLLSNYRRHIIRYTAMGLAIPAFSPIFLTSNLLYRSYTHLSSVKIRQQPQAVNQQPDYVVRRNHRIYEVIYDIST
jgi:hypothetical protein